MVTLIYDCKIIYTVPINRSKAALDLKGRVFLFNHPKSGDAFEVCAINNFQTLIISSDKMRNTKQQITVNYSG